MALNIDTEDSSKLKKSADYIRYLALECIERAKSGHPGLPLGCAEIGGLLYRYILRFNPENTGWANRDRFILSAGHGSMLLYSLLYLTGYDISPKDLENFRQLGSNTPGHPEYEIKHGIETTTGPLGQGFANAVGCAIEGKMLAERFNKIDKGFHLFDYTIYTLMGDGCNMEGISYEAGSMAGHLGLDNLVAIYDSNKISIDGSTEITFTEDVGKRYEALGWHVEHSCITDVAGTLSKLHDLKLLKTGKPKLLILKTTIGEGLDKKKGISEIHGSPAGVDEIAYFIQRSEMRTVFEEKYGKDAVADKNQLVEIIRKRLLNKEPLLRFPACEEFMKQGAEEGKKACLLWFQRLEEYKNAFPAEYKEYESYFNFSFPGELRDKLLNYKEEKADAIRSVSNRVLNLCAETIRQIVGGSADLVGSTKAGINKSSYINRENFSGRNIAFGIREHAMGAIGNGLALNNTMIPFTSTFFTFFDYMKPAVRLAALMKIKHLFIFSHDSIYVGEDGPTHQPVEHLNALRLIPGIYAFRPANAIETALSYLYFLNNMNGPAAIITTRQKVSETAFKDFPDRETLYSQFQKGAYIFYETDHTQKPDIILYGSGSELSTALETATLIEQKDQKRVRVISIPCLELFNESENSYKRQLLIPGSPIVMIEAASYKGVRLFFDSQINLVNIDTFGSSAPDKKLAEYFGFTAEAVYKRLKEPGTFL